MWGWGGESLEQLRAPGEGSLWSTQMRGVVSFSESEAFPGICPSSALWVGKPSPLEGSDRAWMEGTSEESVASAAA